MRIRVFACGLALASAAAAGLMACDDGAFDACVDCCKSCPDGQIITAETDCDALCSAWEEAADVASCDEHWDDDWECYEESGVCPKDPASTCDFEFEDCVEDYCRASEANRAECDEIWRKHALP